MGTPADKAFLHQLFNKYYGSREQTNVFVNEDGRGVCVVCGHKRKLGKRGTAKNKCKKCRTSS